MAKTGYIASIAPCHPISYPYVRTYMPRGAARDVIKWAWSKFRARFARGILQPPLCQNPAYATDGGHVLAVTPGGGVVN